MVPLLPLEKAIHFKTVGHFIAHLRCAFPLSRSQREHFKIATQSFQESVGFISRPKVISLRICDAPPLPLKLFIIHFGRSKISPAGSVTSGSALSVVLRNPPPPEWETIRLALRESCRLCRLRGQTPRCPSPQARQVAFSEENDGGRAHADLYFRKLLHHQL